VCGAQGSKNKALFNKTTTLAVGGATKYGIRCRDHLHAKEQWEIELEKEQPQTYSPHQEENTIRPE